MEAAQGYLKTALIERFVLVFVIAVFVINVSPFVALAAYVIFSISHFLMTHTDQWRRGVYNKKNVTTYVLIAITTALCLWLNKGYSIIFISSFFLLHSFFDDLRLMNLTVNRYNVLAALPHIIFTAVNSFDSVMHTQGGRYAVMPAMAGYLMILVYSIFKGLWRNAYIFYVLCITAIIFLIYFEGPHDAAVKTFCFILMMHYFNWYTYVYHKYKALFPEMLRPYIWEAVCLNAVFWGSVPLSIFLARNGLLAFNHNPLYWAIFQPYAFQLCGLTHLVVTLRKNDYLGLSRLLIRA